MSTVVLFNKPYGVVCQFSAHSHHRTLKDFIVRPDVYAAGRLDADSEGLVVLTDDGRLQHQISDPAHKLRKRYVVQLEGLVTDRALDALRKGVALSDGLTRRASVRRIDEPAWLWPREPPIRKRLSVATTWIEIALIEGRNRQIRRMTAAVGFPTLRLIRYAVGDWTIEGIMPGAWRELGLQAPAQRANGRASTDQRQPNRARHVKRLAIPHVLFKRKKR